MPGIFVTNRCLLDSVLFQTVFRRLSQASLLLSLGGGGGDIPRQHCGTWPNVCPPQQLPAPGACLTCLPNTTLPWTRASSLNLLSSVSDFWEPQATALKSGGCTAPPGAHRPNSASFLFKWPINVSSHSNQQPQCYSVLLTSCTGYRHCDMNMCNGHNSQRIYNTVIINK